MADEAELKHGPTGVVPVGQALLIIEGEERPLRAWDLIHCPAGVRHVTLGQAQFPASWWPLGRAIARQAATGAHIPSTLPRCDIVPGSGKKRPSRTKSTQGMRRRQPVAFDPDWLPEAAV
jgi:hypothetical protein